MLAAEHAGVAQEAEFKVQVAALAATARDGLVANAAFHPGAAFFRYPLRTVGFSAILAHAATHDEAGLQAVRSRLLSALADSSLSTFERGTALLHSQWLIERDIKALKRMEPPSLEGAQVELARAGFGFSARVGLATPSLKVGAFDGVAVWKATVRVPLSKVQAKSAGMSLNRSYFVIRNNEKLPLAAGQEVKQGEDVYVQLDFDAREEPQWRELRSAYYVVEDAIPAGFVVLQEDKAYRGPPLDLPLTQEALRRRAFSPERITWYFEEKAWWSARPSTIGYVLRAQFPGTFVAPPASIEDMYASKVAARTTSASLTIVK